jgi:hypothetical protein
MDARTYQFTKEPSVVYFANPFGRRFMTQFLRNIEASLGASPREMYVVYYLPIDDVFDGSRYFTRFVTGMNYSVYWASAQADNRASRPPGAVADSP